MSGLQLCFPALPKPVIWPKPPQNRPNTGPPAPQRCWEELRGALRHGMPPAGVRWGVPGRVTGAGGGGAGKCRKRPTQGLLLLRRRQRRTQPHRACQLRVERLVVPSLPQLLNLPRCGRLCEQHLELGAAPIIQNRSVECLHGSRCAGGPVKLDIAHLHTTDRGDSGRPREAGAPQMRSNRSGGMAETPCIHSRAPGALHRNLLLISCCSGGASSGSRPVVVEAARRRTGTREATGSTERPSTASQLPCCATARAKRGPIVLPASQQAAGSPPDRLTPFSLISLMFWIVPKGVNAAWSVASAGKQTSVALFAAQEASSDRNMPPRTFHRPPTDNEQPGAGGVADTGLARVERDHFAFERACPRSRSVRVS